MNFKSNKAFLYFITIIVTLNVSSCLKKDVSKKSQNVESSNLSTELETGLSSISVSGTWFTSCSEAEKVLTWKTCIDNPKQAECQEAASAVESCNGSSSSQTTSNCNVSGTWFNSCEEANDVVGWAKCETEPEFYACQEAYEAVKLCDNSCEVPVSSSKCTVSGTWFNSCDDAVKVSGWSTCQTDPQQTACKEAIDAVAVCSNNCTVPKTSSTTTTSSCSVSGAYFDNCDEAEKAMNWNFCLTSPNQADCAEAIDAVDYCESKGCYGTSTPSVPTTSTSTTTQKTCTVSGAYFKDCDGALSATKWKSCQSDPNQRDCAEAFDAVDTCKANGCYGSTNTTTTTTTTTTTNTTTTTSGSNLGTLLLKDNFESGLGLWNTDATSGSGSGGLSTLRKVSGKYAFYATTEKANDFRDEIVPKNNVGKFFINNTYCISFKVNMKKISVAPTWLSFFQTHAAPSSDDWSCKAGKNAVSITGANHKLGVNVNTSPATTTPPNGSAMAKTVYEQALPYDQWVSVDILLRPAFDNKGAVKVWFNKKKVYERLNAANMDKIDSCSRPSASYVYSKFGLYRQKELTSKQEAFFDDISIYQGSANCGY